MVHLIGPGDTKIRNVLVTERLQVRKVLCFGIHRSQVNHIVPGISAGACLADQFQVMLHDGVQLGLLLLEGPHRQLASITKTNHPAIGRILGRAGGQVPKSDSLDPGIRDPRRLRLTRNTNPDEGEYFSHSRESQDDTSQNISIPQENEVLAGGMFLDLPEQSVLPGRGRGRPKNNPPQAGNRNRRLLPVL